MRQKSALAMYGVMPIILSRISLQSIESEAQHESYWNEVGTRAQLSNYRSTGNRPHLTLVYHSSQWLPNGKDLQHDPPIKNRHSFMHDTSFHVVPLLQPASSSAFTW